MSLSQNNMEQLLERVINGGLEEISAADIASLEQALHANPSLADRLANATPPPDSMLQTKAARPTEAEWSHVWNGIETRQSGSSSALPSSTPRVFRLWRAAAAVAACIVLFALWRNLPLPGSGGEIQLASSANVEILEMEVYGGRSATLHFADDGSGAVIISISDPENDDSGAS